MRNITTVLVCMFTVCFVFSDHSDFVQLDAPTSGEEEDVMETSRATAAGGSASSASSSISSSFRFLHPPINPVLAQQEEGEGRALRRRFYRARDHVDDDEEDEQDGKSIPLYYCVHLVYYCQL